ncbi:MAG: MotA/TolQ/ExbB proton channel family protein [Polyangiaceae bacterium]
MDLSLAKLWAEMGLLAKGVVITTFIMSIVSLYVTVDRVVTFYKSQRDSLDFARRVSKTLQGGVPAVASMALPQNLGHLGRVIAAGIDAYNKRVQDDSDIAFESVARALERQAQREILRLKRGSGALATIAATAPFVGLLGTVMGIVNAFQKMAASGSGGLGTVSAGISEALITTAFGLFVAIPAVGVYNGVQGWIDARSVDISESSNEFLDAVAKQLHVERPKAEAA